MSTTRTFAKEDLKNLTSHDYDANKWEIVLDEIIDTSRWAIHYKMIFKFEDKYYKTFYQRGATEYQDERPYENDEILVKCDEVKPVEVKVVKYINV